jgi:hypothetical protein
MRPRIPYRQTFEDWMRALKAAPSWESLAGDFVLFRDAQDDLLRRLQALEAKADGDHKRPSPTKEQKS